MHVRDSTTGDREFLVIQTKFCHKLFHSNLAEFLQVLTFHSLPFCLRCENYCGENRTITEAIHSVWVEG